MVEVVPREKVGCEAVGVAAPVAVVELDCEPNRPLPDGCDDAGLFGVANPPNKLVPPPPCFGSSGFLNPKVGADDVPVLGVPLLEPNTEVDCPLLFCCWKGDGLVDPKSPKPPVPVDAVL